MTSSAVGQVQARAIQHAKDQLYARRLHPVTGVQATRELLKLDQIGYRRVHRRDVHTEFAADRVGEVTTMKEAPLLEALPEDEAAQYAKEENVIEMTGKSTQH
eukprot:8594055-Pyramimonas_sp.AAC.1